MVRRHVLEKKNDTLPLCRTGHLSLAGIIEQAEHAKKTLAVPETTEQSVLDTVTEHVGVTDDVVDHLCRAYQ